MANAPKNEQKKILILGAMGLLLVGVGAFQMMGGSPAPEPKSDRKEAEVASATDANAADKNADNPAATMFTGQLAQRDPFLPDGARASEFNPSAPTMPSATASTGNGASNGGAPAMPAGSGGDFAPTYEPTQPVMPAPIPDAPSTATNTGTQEAIEPEAPSFIVTGVVHGNTSMAAIRINSKSMLVRVGENIDGWEIRSIGKRSVTVTKDGQSKTITLKSNEPS